MQSFRFPFIAAAVLAAVACGCGSSAPSAESAGKVVRVVDGDTLVVEIGHESERVRLLGIDTPERARSGAVEDCGADAATRSLEQVAAPGARVRLVTDPKTGDVRDRYDRLLAFAVIDGRDLGLLQVRRGWARVYAYRDRRFDGRSRYERAESDAVRQGRGVHRVCPGGR